MKVFWVLFLVLLNNIGNQGDPIQPDEVPTYLVSVRNASGCHICTGSMISVSWGLTSFLCQEADHILPGLKEFNICSGTEDSTFPITINGRESRYLSGAFLFKVEIDSNRKKLSLPTTSSCCHIFGRSDFGKVTGWSFDNSRRKFVMKTIKDVPLSEVFNANNTALIRTFVQISTGSPLIIHDVFIYGFFRHGTPPFYDIREEANWFKDIMYTQSEIVDMLLIFGEGHRNSRNAAELYAQRFPNRQHPAHRYFPYVENRFSPEGNLEAEQKLIIDEETEISVLAMTEVDKIVSLRGSCTIL